MNKTFTDLRITEKFYSDYNHLYDDIKARVDRIVTLISKSGKLPNSLSVHKAKFVEDIWIAYVTRTGQHYRILFYIDGNTLVFDRVFSHREMDDYFRSLV